MATATMLDFNGTAVPTKYVSAYDKAKDRAVRRIHSRFTKARAMLERLVKESVDDLAALKLQKDKVGERGNFAAQSFDGLLHCGIRQQYNILLDERVISARALMLDYVNGVLDKVDGVDVSALRLLVEEAFRANSEGYLPAGKILSLTRLEVKDDNWRRAREILLNALRPVKGKQYLFCESRERVRDEFKRIHLDLAYCWPADGEKGGAE